MADHEKFEVIRKLEEQFGHRFTHLPEKWNEQLVRNFREASPINPDSLQPFWDATVALGKATMYHVPAILNHSALFVCVPRGAYPLTIGVTEQYRNVGIIVTNDGAYKNSDPLIPDSVPKQSIGTLFFVDSVLDQGGTLDKTLEALSRRIFAERIVMPTVIAHPPTVERVLLQYPSLHIVTADTESKFIPAAVGSGFWLAGFGDIGGIVEAYATETGQSHLMSPPGWYPDGL